MNKRKILITAVCLAVFIAIAGGVWWITSRTNVADQPAAVEKFTRLDIKLSKGVPVTPAATYLVQPGTKLEFHIESEVMGKISVPTEPLQTITFTESPLIFQFNAPITPGNYQLLYQAEDVKEVIILGTITVRDNS